MLPVAVWPLVVATLLGHGPVVRGAVVVGPAVLFVDVPFLVAHFLV